MLFPPWLLRAGSGAAFAASSLTPCLLSWLLAGPLHHVGPVAAVLLALGLAAVQLSSSRKVPSSRSCSLAPAWVVCVPVGLKRPKRTWGEKICGWSQQVIERVSPKYPQLVLPWLKTYSSPGTVLSAKHCRKGHEESFQPVLCFIFDSFHFPFSSEGTQLEQESQCHWKGIYYSRIHYWVRALSPCLATAGHLCNLLNTLESFKHLFQNLAMKHRRQLVLS